MAQIVDSRVDARSALTVREAYLSARLQQIETDRRRSEPLPQDFEDQATEQENDPVLDNLATTTAAELADVRLALQRLDSDQYGVCSECGAAINAERLRAVPEAVTCIDCALAHA
jgi:DnaK suppressor protein